MTINFAITLSRCRKVNHTFDVTLYQCLLYPINFILVVIIVIVVFTTTENRVKVMVWINFFFYRYDLRFVEKGNLEVQLFILTSKLRANHQKMYTPPENKALSDINKVSYFILLLSLNTVTGLSEVAGCRRKLPPTWLVSAGYSVWHFFTDSVFYIKFPWTVCLL